MTSPAERHQVIKRVPLGDGHVVVIVDVDPGQLSSAEQLRLQFVEESLAVLEHGGLPLKAAPSPSAVGDPRG